MNYKKPQIVAKSETKRSYVAGCPQLKKKGVKPWNGRDYGCVKCEISGS